MNKLVNLVLKVVVYVCIIIVMDVVKVTYYLIMYVTHVLYMEMKDV